MNTDKINIENMTTLRNYCVPKINDKDTSNFERLCAVGLVFLGMWLDQEIKDKGRDKVKVY